MIRLENRNYLRLSNRALLQRLDQAEHETDEMIVSETAKNGEPTLKMKVGSAFQYIHSRYNPTREAEGLVAAFGDLNAYEHVLFIGTGLGYAVKIAAQAYPDKQIYIYEPNLKVLEQFFSVQDLSEPWAASVRLITSDANKALETVGQAIDETGQSFYFAVLPFYERNEPEQVKNLLNRLKERLLNRQSALYTDFSFQQRWITNAVHNFPNVLATPNILMDIDPSIFQGKPVMLIAAGPSLNAEFDRLKQIKAERSAYLFAVGSAINALLAHDIVPDAFCSYDPTVKNQQVAQLVKDRKLTQLPMIFGSTIGCETLDGYPGPLLHVVNLQDTLSPLLLKRTDGAAIAAVNDAPSIAVVTLQMLLALKAEPIILAGQNLAYFNESSYAQGIVYHEADQKLSEADQKNIIKVKDVDGNEVATTRSFNSMRRDLELYIAQHPGCRVINTTRGGAAIAGAPFQPLEEVMAELVPDVVVDDWQAAGNNYDTEYAQQALARLIWQGREYKELFEKAVKALRQLKLLNERQAGGQQLEAQIEKANRVLQRLQKNNFYSNLIVPMMRVQVARFNKAGNRIREMTDSREKTKTVLQEINLFLSECGMNYQMVFPLVERLRDQIAN
ncbi:MAG: 6-hydroxymethylpterin diphosphokinase MptE-like protein [Sporolactobacillus sp.]